MLPWSEMEGFHRETGSIQEQLQQLNLQGYFTINSQPQVNGAPSSDAKVGWGGTDGYAPVLAIYSTCPKTKVLCPSSLSCSI